MAQLSARCLPRRGRQWLLWLACLVSACLLAAPLPAAAASELRETPVVKAVRRASGAIVNIRGEKTVAAATGQATAADAGRRVNGMGTGVLIDPRGYILTDYHVVDGVHEIHVTRADGQRHVARLLARDKEADLAILKIDCSSPLPVIPIGTSSDLMAGETVIAVGNAYGYEHTVTRGIISALHRSVQVSEAQYYDDLIQTDASINPGNSGGPLLNIDGEMIGINVAVRAGAQGIGFAIPADRVVAVAANLLASCHSGKTWTGLESLADAPPQRGAVVGSIEAGSPAADAGLAAGDLIVAAGDDPVDRPLDFQRVMLDRKAGETLRLAVRRSGNPLTLNLKLGAVPESARLAGQPAWALLGVELKPIPTDEFRKTHTTHYRGGLAVVAIRPDSPAASQGILPGDVLVGMHIWETLTLENVAYIIRRPDFATLGPVKFFIVRGDETLYGYLPAPVAKTAQR